MDLVAIVGVGARRAIAKSSNASMARESSERDKESIQVLDVHPLEK
jgi:hypothetical protein